MSLGMQQYAPTTSTCATCKFDVLQLKCWHSLASRCSWHW